MHKPSLSIIVSTLFEDVKGLKDIVSDLGSVAHIVDVELILVIQLTGNSVNKDTHTFIRYAKNNIKLKYEIMNQIGVSKGRNRGIELARNDIIVFADTDCRFPKQSLVKVQSAYAGMPTATAITFRANNSETGEFVKDYWSKRRRHTRKTIMRTATWEISVRRERVNELNIRFDENFGLGSRWPSSSEPIFMWDLMDQDRELWYVPETIVTTPPSKDRRMDRVILASKGAMIRRTWGWFGVLLGVPFVIRRAILGNLVQGVLVSFCHFYWGFFSMGRAS